MVKKVRFSDSPSITYFKKDDPPNKLDYSNSLFSYIADFLKNNSAMLIFIVCFFLLFINL
jgi:hypothetical protein